MARVETTTIRVRRDTHERLQRQAEITGQSVTQVLAEAADLLEEAKLLEGAEESWKQMAEMPAEVFALDGSLDDEAVREIESRPPPAEQAES
jgi:uncharacterized protein (DUF1778 family)